MQLKMKSEIFLHFQKNNLLTFGGNQKIEKNEIPTYNLSLLPHTLNSKKENLCTFSTKECRSVCLVSSGKGIFSNVHKARERRTEFYVNYKKAFLTLLASELLRINTLHDKALVRLNTFSDVNWNKELKTIGINIEMFNNIISYNYTKIPSYILNKAKNEEFTYSFSGYNWKECEQFLVNKLCNVSVIFKNEIPNKYKGFKVLNGNDSDMRLKEFDGVGNIIGLSFKNPKNGNEKNIINNKFII